MHIGFDGRSLHSPAAGVRRYAEQLLLALSRQPAADIIAFGPPDMSRLPPAVRSHSVRPLVPTNFGWSAVNLPLAVRPVRLDVFHAPAYTAPLLGVHPLVVTIHDVSYARHPEWYPYRRDPFRQWFYRQSAHAADIIITDSEFSRGEIASAYGIDAGRIRVVPLGVGPPFTRHGPPPPSPVRTPYVLHVGDLHPRRSVETIIRALSRLAISRREVPALVLAGRDRGSRGTLDRQAREAGVALITTEHASDDELVALYAGASAFVYASRYEGFGLPLLEAMACGAPVVATRCAATPEVVGEAGILVRPDDDEEMSAALAQVLDSPHAVNQFRAAGRQRAAAFTWDRTAALTMDSYREAIGR